MKLLHLSDLHLGNDFIPRAILSRRRWWKRVSPDLQNGLTDALKEHSCDYVIISGDFVNKPDEKAFEYSADFIRTVLVGAQVDIPTRLLTVPGNHDVSFFPYQHNDDFERLLPYRRFLVRLFQEKTIESRKPRFRHIDPDRKLIFLALDTTSLKGLLPGAHGQVGSFQLEWARKKMEGARKLLPDFDSYVKIAIMHHHCVPLAGDTARSEQLMQLLDAGKVIQMLEAYGFNVVLHGHKHYPHVTFHLRSDSGAMTVIGAGTTTCPYVEEQKTFGNNFNLLEIDGDQLTVTRYKANPAGQFEINSPPQTKPLFRAVDEGYRTGIVRQIVTIVPDGTVVVVSEKQQIRIELNTKVRKLPVRIMVTKPSKFLYCKLMKPNHGAELKWTIQDETTRDGYVEFDNDLTHQSGAFDLRYDYSVEKGMAMAKTPNSRYRVHRGRTHRTRRPT